MNMKINKRIEGGGANLYSLNAKQAKKLSLFTLILLFFCAAILGCAFLAPKKAAKAEASSASDKLIQLTLDSTNLVPSVTNGYMFDAEGLNKLYNAILGTTNSSYESVVSKLTGANGSTTQTWTSSTSTAKTTVPNAITAAQIRTNNGGKNVQVKLGKTEFEVVYVTFDNSGDLIVTLWQSTSTQTSPWAANASGAPGHSPSNGRNNNAATRPGNVYGNSYIRAKMLGQGGTWDAFSGQNSASSVQNTTEGNSVSTTYGALWNSCTTGALSSYIDTPSQVKYQEVQSYSAFERRTNNGASGTGWWQYTLPGDAYGTPYDEYYHDGSTHYWNSGINTGYGGNGTNKISGQDQWKDDKLWLPSIAETGFNSVINYTSSAVAGIWGLDNTQRSNNGNAAPSKWTWNTTNSNVTWLRSGYASGAIHASCLTSTGAMHDTYTSATLAVRPALHLNLAKADAAKAIEAPNADLTEFTYNGTLQTYNPVGFNADYMEIANNKQSDVGDYTVTVTTKTGYVFTDGTCEKTYNFHIDKAKPTVVPNFGAERPFVHTGLPQPESYTATCNGSDVTGKFEWRGNQTIESNVSKEYEWTFVPDDDTNYGEVTGKQTFNFQERSVTDLKAEFDAGGKTVYTKTPESELRGMITLTVTYSDGETAEEQNYTLLGADSLKAGSGNKLTLKFGSQYTDVTINVDVVPAAVESLRVVYAQGANKVTPQTSLDDLKNYLTVIPKWNYTNNSAELSPEEYTVEGTLTVNNPDVYVSYGGVQSHFVPTVSMGTYDMSGVTLSGETEVTYDGNAHTLEVAVEDLPSGVTLSGITYNGSSESPVDAGTYEVRASFSGDSENYNDIPDITATLKINKAKIEGVAFVGQTVTYNGEPQTIVITGNLPEGVEVSYYCNDKAFTGATEVGNYTVKAVFTDGNPNYEKLADMTATLIISDKPTFPGQDDINVDTDTEIEFTGDPVDPWGIIDYPSGIKVTVTIKDKDGNVVDAITNAGEYTVIYSFKVDPQYAPIPDKIVTITVQQGVYPESIIFEDKSVKYDGTAFTIEAANLPEGVSVEYLLNGEPFVGVTEVGTYSVTAKFTHSNPNYKPIPDKTATLTVLEKGYELLKPQADKAWTGEELDFTPEGFAEIVDLVEVYSDGKAVGAQYFKQTEVGTYTVTVKFKAGEYPVFEGDIDSVELTFSVTKQPVAVPVFAGGISYTGQSLVPTAENFGGFDGAIMRIDTAKSQSGIKVGGYKAVIKLTDTEHYVWSSGKSAAKSGVKLTLTDEVALEEGETQVSWNIARAVISVSKKDGKLPVLTSESYKGNFGEVVGYKYFTDETCSEEIAFGDLENGKTYYVRAELLDTENFELAEGSVEAFNSVFTYETQPTFWQKVMNFLKANWLWIVIALAAIALLITLICIIAHRRKTKEIREEKKAAKEEEKRRREQEREIEKAKAEAELAKMRAGLGLGAGAAGMAMAAQQPMPQQMQPMQYSAPVAQSAPVQAVSADALTALKAEIEKLREEARTERETAKAVAEAERRAEEKAERRISELKMQGEFERLRAGLFGFTPTAQGENVSKSAELLSSALVSALNKMLSDARAAEAKAEVPQVVKTESPVVLSSPTVYPPDAVITTTTTVDTTKSKPTEPVSRDSDRDRSFDVDGFYDNFDVDKK